MLSLVAEDKIALNFFFYVLPTVEEDCSYIIALESVQFKEGVLILEYYVNIIVFSRRPL